MQSTFKKMKDNEHLEQIEQIRSIMERSSRFISLSGLSGVFAGVVALVGSTIAFFYLNYNERYFNPAEYFNNSGKVFYLRELLVLFLLAMLVFLFAVGGAFIFTYRRTKKTGAKLWSFTSRQLAIQLMLPLAAGGVFCFILLYYGIVFLVAPATLIFYGLALINAGKYTLSEIKWLGISELTLGLVASILPGYGLISWALGFGVLHIIYGIAMYFRHEYAREAKHK